MKKLDLLKLVILIGVLVALIYLLPVKAHAQEIVDCSPYTPCYVNAYNYCVEECLNTYANIDLTYTCEQYCQVNPQVVVVLPNSGSFYHGRYIPRRGFYPRERNDRSHNHYR